MAFARTQGRGREKLNAQLLPLIYSSHGHDNFDNRKPQLYTLPFRGAPVQLLVYARRPTVPTLAGGAVPSRGVAQRMEVDPVDVGVRHELPPCGRGLHALTRVDEVE